MMKVWCSACRKPPSSVKRPTGCAAWAWQSSGRWGGAGRDGRQLLPDPETIGLDAVFPAILLALVVPAFKNRTTLDPRM